jgi:hypothetical protein
MKGAAERIERGGWRLELELPGALDEIQRQKAEIRTAALARRDALGRDARLPASRSLAPNGFAATSS